MASYYLAPSLVKLYVEEINARWPKRDRSSDGWIGDPSHAARTSDHNPDWNDGGVVRAVDIDVDGIAVRELLNAAIGDPRVWYVIYNRVIYSRTYDWRALAYTGSNPHTAHVHISIRHTDAAEEDMRDWLGDKPRTRGMPSVDLSVIRYEFDAASPSTSLDVKRVQRALNKRLAVKLDVDGIAGRATRRAWLLHERKMQLDEPNDRPHMHSLRLLGRGRFRAVQ